MSRSKVGIAALVERLGPAAPPLVVIEGSEEERSIQWIDRPRGGGFERTVAAGIAGRGRRSRS